MKKLTALVRWVHDHVRWLMRIFLVLLIADLAYLTLIWPDWNVLAKGDIPKTNFMNLYEQKRVDKGWPKLRWSPVPLSSIPKSMVRAVIVAEDSRFYEHSGFDLIAIKDAWDYNVERGRVAFGASTISQQTAKNLFLSPARNPVRKWHELLLTLGLEHHLSKQRILEIYLNTAEFGRGIYGVQAASQAYWGIPVSRISATQAAELAATLPGPIKHNPANRSDFFLRHSKRILGLMGPRYVEPAENLDTGGALAPMSPAVEPSAAPVEVPPAAPEPMDNLSRTI
jgi:monofunctional biosynthetic peptidoglycan transglycosylase